MKKIVYIISDINKALAFEWLALHLKTKFNLVFILIGEPKTTMETFLIKENIPYHFIDGRKSLWSQSLGLFKILSKENPALVHTHLWKANILGLTISWLQRIPKRIYTRHHATLHYREYPSGLKWDKLCNFLATDIVAISQNIKNILTDWDGAKLKKVHLIHHGFISEYFTDVTQERVDSLRQKYKINSQPVVGVISRYTHWKGIQYIIPAFAKLRIEFPTAQLILSNAKGDYTKQIKNLLEQYLPVDSYTEIEFESDLAALYKLFDIFVHVPIDKQSEAFGQTYVEALFSGVPSIFTSSGIASEFIKHKENAWVVPFQNSEEIFEGMTSLLIDTNLKFKIIREGKESVNLFLFEKHFEALLNLYS